jgi:hypothetical protein
MTNIQQPEMRRSGHDPLVTDNAEERASSSLPRKQTRKKDTRPAGQRSSYGPEGAESKRAPEAGR